MSANRTRTLVLALGLLAVACSLFPQKVDVRDAFVSWSGRSLDPAVDACNGESTAKVEETAQEVVVTVTVPQ